MNSPRPVPWLGLIALAAFVAWSARPGPGFCPAPPAFVLSGGLPLVTTAFADDAPAARAPEPTTPEPPPAPPHPAAPPASPPRATTNGVEFGKVLVERATRSVLVPATLNQRSGLIEYVLVTDYGKTHESLLITTAQAADLQSALLLVNGQPTGTNAVHAVPHPLPAGSGFDITLEWQDAGVARKRSLASCVVVERPTPAPLSPGPWMFSGSMVSPEGFAAHFEGSLISLITDPVAIVNNPRAEREDDEIHRPGPDLPPLGTEVLVRLTPVTPGRP